MEVTAKHLGGPDDDHYAKLGVQPLEAVEAWARHWPPEITYHLGEAVASIARCGTKGQMVRDLEKAAFLIGRAAKIAGSCLAPGPAGRACAPVPLPWADFKSHGPTHIGVALGPDSSAG